MNIYGHIKEASITKDLELNVGDTFKNKEGSVITIIEPTKEGRPQFNIKYDGKFDCRDTDNYDTLADILKVNGYERFTETEEPETVEELEAEIEKIRTQLDYCERRDAVCATFGSEQERAELEARFIELSEKLNKLEGVEECSLKEEEYKYTFTDKYYIVNADDFERLVDTNKGVFEKGYVEISKDEFTRIAKDKGFFDDQDITLEESARTFKIGDTVYWVGAGNEISATGKITDFPTEGRMTIKWDDGDVNTYDTDHPDIQHEDDYEEWLEDSEKPVEESTAIEDIDTNFSPEVRKVIDAFSGNSKAEFFGALDEISALEDANKISRDEYERAIDFIKEVYKLSKEDVYDYFTEAVNSKNAEANEIIKSALKDAMFAIENKDKLKDLGIDVEVKKWHEDEPVTSRNLSKVYLVGPNGRKLNCNTSGWGELERSRDITSTSDDWAKNRDENTIEQTTYGPSRKAVVNAKLELPTLKRRLKLYERRYGKDSSQYRELVSYIKQTERTIENGIKAQAKDTYNTRTPHDAVDYKNYLEKKPVADREKPYEAPKMNPTVAAYKGAKADEAYEAREEERNKKQDEEDAQRVADYARRAAEDKSRRDAYLAKSKERTQATLKEIRDRIAASKAKRGAE